MNWFKSYGWFYLPVSIPGFAITILLVAAFIHDFIFINNHSHSVSDLYYHFAPYGFMYVATWLWIGSKSSGKH